MNFNYPNLKTINFNDQRWYVAPTGYYPSITTVLGATTSLDKVKSLEEWRNSLGHEKADEISQIAANNGTILHAIVERYLKHEKDLLAPVNGHEIETHNIEAFNGIKMKLNNIDEVWCLETSLYSNTFEIAGRVDCVGKYKKIPSIIDFKTSRRMKNQDDIEDYKFQLAAYALMHNDMFNTNIEQGIILMSASGGFPMEFKVDLTKYFQPLYNRIQIFYDQLNSKLKIAVG